MNASLLVVGNQIQTWCGPSDGGRYDLRTACPKCGTGARRIDPISLASELLEDRVCVTFDLEVLIPPRLVSSIRAVAPACLREVLDRTSRRATGYFELIPEVTLPPWSPSTTGVIRDKLTPPCRQCQRDGHYNTIKALPGLCYDVPISPFTVAETYERFGRSGFAPDFRKSRFAPPFLLINNSVQESLLVEDGVELLPVDFLK